MMSEYENMRTADIVAEALIDWKVEFIFGLPGDGINGFIEALRKRQDKIKFILLRYERLQHLWHVHMPNTREN
jgi:pyruvate dehydrogenase (quinone)/pyruvate oxidase